MSKDYENTIANELYRETPNHIKAYRCGYSGSNAIPQPDVLVTTADDMNHALELKGPIASQYVSVDADDVAQVVDCGGPMTRSWVVVKFQNRRPVSIPYYANATGVDGWGEMTPAARLAKVAPAPFDGRVTDSGTLRLTKPDTDDWPSARASPEDHVCILAGIGVSNETSQQL